MKGLAPLVLGIGILALVVLGALAFTTGVLPLTVVGGGPSVDEIVERNLGYACEWSGKLSTMLGEFKAGGRYYFHGRRVRLEQDGLMGTTVFLDPDITDENGVVYQWAVSGGKVLLSVSFTKIERPPSSYEGILRIVYEERDRPFRQVLEETLKSVPSTAYAKYSLESLRCGPWTPDESLFTPPQSS